MMFFAPIIDAAFTKETALKLGLPILFLVFGWSFAYSFNVARQFVVGLDGFGEMSGVTLVGIYVFSRMFRLLDWQRYVSNKLAGLILLLTLPLTAIRFGAYDSPVALVVAMSMFVLASRIKLAEGKLTRIIQFLTPSLFAIYLLQVNSFAWPMFPKTIAAVRATGCPDILLFIGLTIVVFLFGLSIDLVRRGIVWLKR